MEPQLLFSAWCTAKPSPPYRLVCCQYTRGHHCAATVRQLLHLVWWLFSAGQSMVLNCIDVQCRIWFYILNIIYWLCLQWLKRVDYGSNYLVNTTITVKGQQFVVLKSGKIWARQDGSYINKLSIYPIAEEHAGMYVCLAANSMGFNFKSAHLTVMTGEFSLHENIALLSCGMYITGDNLSCVFQILPTTTRKMLDSASPSSSPSQQLC